MKLLAGRNDVYKTNFKTFWFRMLATNPSSRLVKRWVFN